MLLNWLAFDATEKSTRDCGGYPLPLMGAWGYPPFFLASPNPSCRGCVIPNVAGSPTQMGGCKWGVWYIEDDPLH